MGRLRASNEEIVAAYRETGNVWKAAKKLGLCGQSVHERLRAIGHPLHAQDWTDEEHAELEALAAAGCTIGQIASRLGRPYAGVACKLSRRQIPIGRKGQPKPPRFLYTKQHAKRFRKELIAKNLSLRQYARQNSLDIDAVVGVLQRFEPDFWFEWTKRHGLPEPSTCPNCGRTFYALTKKQICCTRRCSSLYLNDRNYFGGKRKQTVGLESGCCQLCQREDKHLSSHHIFGKEYDPENDYLIALCRGCHNVVELLAARKFVHEKERWEELIGLVLLRALKQRPTRFFGQSVYVEIEHYTKAEWLQMYPEDEEVAPRPPKPPAPKKRKGQPNLLNGLEPSETQEGTVQ